MYREGETVQVVRVVASSLLIGLLPFLFHFCPYDGKKKRGPSLKKHQTYPLRFVMLGSSGLVAASGGWE